LRERAYGCGLTAANKFHSRHECGAYGSHSRSEDAQSSFGRSNIYGPAHSISPSPCEFSRSVHSRVAKPSLFRNGCVIGAVNAGIKTSYDAARLEFLQIESTRRTHGNWKAEKIMEQNSKEPAYLGTRVRDCWWTEWDPSRAYAAPTKE